MSYPKTKCKRDEIVAFPGEALSGYPRFASGVSPQEQTPRPRSCAGSRGPFTCLSQNNEPWIGHNSRAKSQHEGRPFYRLQPQACLVRTRSYFALQCRLLIGQAHLRLQKFVSSRSLGHPCGGRRAHCPICHETALQFQYEHKEFRHTKVRICARCGHGYADRDFVIKRSGLWSTNRERADYYLSEVIPSWVRNLQGKKFLEIGASDLYLLSKLTALCPGLLLYAYDTYHKGAPPEHTTVLNDLGDVSQVDYILMLHTLEHVYRLDAFLVELTECLTENAVLIVEVPNNSIAKHRDVQSGKHVTGYHLQFFNESSLAEALLRHGFKPLVLSSYGPHRWGLSGINLLGVFQYSDR